MPLRVALDSVGCKLNAYETEALACAFQGLGYRVVEPDAQTEICVVNTCTVTRGGDADSRKAVRRARRLNPHATVVVTGCYAQRSPSALVAAGADLVVGNAHKARLPGIVQAFLAGRVPDPLKPMDSPGTTRFLGVSGPVPGGRTRGSLQIQDGCDEHCTYCIIPAVRGPSVSRPAAEVVDQARRMVESGYREVALTGVHTGSYGHDKGTPNALIDLLESLETVSGLKRIRLNSIEPAFLSNALIEHVSGSRRICRHFHVPLQSGDDRILRRMGRRYTRDYYAERIQRISATIPGCAIGADVMVGFPGEEEAAFQRSYDLLADLPVTYLHVFSYSSRPGTPAARLPGHLTPAVKKGRSRKLIQLGRDKRRAFHQRHIGSLLRILVEDRPVADGLATGLSDNYVRALVAAPGPANQIVTVRVNAADDSVVRGVLEDQPS